MATIELRRISEGRWAWTYRDEHVVLHSNDVYETAEAAEASARSAYPGVPITRVIGGGAPKSQGQRGGLAFLLMMWAVWRNTRRGT
ncbi:MAG: hypothetical protein ACRDKB_00080 [Actinomycetota bacterium]